MTEYTTDPAALVAFLEKARQAYQTLEQGIAPIDAKIEELQKDWEPRPAGFWAPILRISIPELRQAARTCSRLFSRDEAVEMPLIITGVSLSHTINLYHLDSKIEEAGILLTAALHYTGSPAPSVEKRIRERQRLKSALEDVSKATYQAIREGHIKLKEAEALEEQRKRLALRKRRTQPKATKPQGSHTAEGLRLLGSGEHEEGSSNEQL